MKLFDTLRQLNRQRNTKTKKIKDKIKVLILKNTYRPKTTIAPEKYRTVCVFMHTQFIGDSILTSGLIKKLRDNGYRVYVVTSCKIRFIFNEIINIDGIFIFDKETFKKDKKYCLTIR